MDHLSPLGLIAIVVGALSGGGGLVALAQLVMSRRKVRIEPMVTVQEAAVAQMRELRTDLDQLRTERASDHRHIGRLDRRVEQLMQVLRDANMPIPPELPDPNPTVASGGNP